MGETTTLLNAMIYSKIIRVQKMRKIKNSNQALRMLPITHY